MYHRLSHLICLGLVAICVRVAGQSVDSLQKTTIHNHLYTPGHILSLPQVIQGHVPGLLVSRPGANPNESFDMIHRGYHTYEGRMQPLLMIDGIPGLPWHLIDPLMIDSVQVRRGSALSQLGIQGGAGVFDATIRKNNQPGLSIQLMQGVTMEKYQRAYATLTGSAYRSIADPNSYFGTADTNWLDVLTQTAFSSQTSVKIGFQKDRLNSQLFVSNRSVDGIQEKTGFNQLSVYGRFEYSFFKEKLVTGASTMVTYRDAAIGNTGLFHAAVAMNPTVSLTEEINYYSAFGGNPWHSLQNNDRNLVSKMNMSQGFVVLKPVSGLTLEAKMGKVVLDKKQDFQTNGATIYSNTIYRREYNTLEEARDFMALSADYIIAWNGISVQPGVRYTKQKMSYDSWGYNFSRMINNTESRYNKIPNFGSYELNSMGFYLNTSFKSKGAIQVNYQSEASSNLGSNAGRGQFFGIDGHYQLTAKWKIVTAYAQTGLIPDRSGLSRSLYVVDLERNTWNYLHNGNPDLKWEDTRQWEIGTIGNLFKGKINLEFRYYSSISSDFISRLIATENSYSIYNNYYPYTYQNFGEIRNTGTEWQIQLNPVKIGILSYRALFNANRMRSKWTDLDFKYGNLVGLNPGFSRNIGGDPFYYYNTLQTNEPIGTIRSLNYLGIDRNTGEWILNEISGSDWKDAYVPQGQAIPRWQMGWTNSLSLRKWQLNFMLRGVYGHSNLNETNLRYGTRRYTGANIVKSYKKLDDAGLTQYNRMSSYFIENSGFLSLHYVQIVRAIDFKMGKTSFQSTISLVGNNLFYLTRYTGADPEARLSDQPLWLRDEHIISNRSYFTMGIDGLNTWLPSRAFTLFWEVRF